MVDKGKNFMKHITGFSVLCLVAVLLGKTAWAVDGEPSNLPTLATDTYVELAYDSLDAKKQDKLSNGSYVNINTDETTGNKTIDLALPTLANSTDGVYVLTATKGANNQIILNWENITRTTVQNGDM